MIRSNPQWIEKLWENSMKLREGLKEIGYNVLPSESPVTPVLTEGGTELCTTIMRELREKHGIFVSGVADPGVPRGMGLMRLIPTPSPTAEHRRTARDAL